MGTGRESCQRANRREDAIRANLDKCFNFLRNDSHESANVGVRIAGLLSSARSSSSDF